MEIAASGFAFVQVGVGAGKAIVQAIQLWEQVRQLPQDFQSRIKKLKLFRQIISQIEDEFARHPNLRARPTAQQCLEHVRNAEAALLAHVEKMSALVQQPKSKLKRHVNSFKIISLKKEELAALESELAWAMELMQLAISLFHLTGQASPFDRNEAGRSLLYLAAKEERLEVCEMLIRKGVPADDEREKHGYNPIDAIVVSRQNFTGADDENHASLVALFESAAYTSDTLTVERLFNFVAEFSQSDDFLRVYQSQFLRNYQRLPIRDRAEAVRLGSFLVRDATTYRRLLNPATKAVTPADTRESVNEKLSLVHSAAIALGKRLADELQYDPKAFRARSYTDSWSDVVIETVESADGKDLHGVETVVPWDWFRVPVWKGTPLMSLLGGALCRLAPEIPISKWDSVFQRVLGQWLQDLQEAGVDLSEYGKGEATAQKLCPEVKGAFDSDAINASRITVRNELQEPSKESWMNAVDAEFDRSDRYWMPIRIIALDYGPHVKDWRIRWLVEWEAFAGEFWGTVEAPRVIMPGSWID
ncbi:hypothetical protein Brms1b_004496 [Colletotrichum noveboracense]|nr:hypothetical protein COL940_011128 [Colletotrichum noveboracense]KAJ0277013.1 hypothetical protein CBS470a_010505 [Colletotrichum nupharicola]KAJ0318241.1 hypothetical protein Brms1b_004496 [Colletotrichum noveboracense]